VPEASVVTDIQQELPLVSGGGPANEAAEDIDADGVDANTEEQATSPVSDGDEPKKEAKELTPEQEATRERERKERRAQNKLEKAFRKSAEAQARAELAERRIAELEQSRQPADVPQGTPKLEDFDYDPDKYSEAMTQFASKHAQERFKAEQTRTQQDQVRQQLVTAWEEKVERAEDKYEDFSSVVGELKPDNAFTAAIMDAENGEDVAYHLAKNPKEARRIAALPPLSQAREVGKLEAKLQAEPAKPKTPSKAPAPITPLAGSGATPGSDAPSDDDDMASWMKKRQKQVHGSQ